MAFIQSVIQYLIPSLPYVAGSFSSNILLFFFLLYVFGKAYAFGWKFPLSEYKFKKKYGLSLRLKY